jgi:DNA-binding NarL/FixJ family response regulator
MSAGHGSPIILPMTPKLKALPTGRDRSPITVLIADDHPMIIAGIRRTLDAYDDIDVVGEARSGPELLALVERRSPALVLMDLGMPGVSGCDCVAQIRTQWPETKIVVLSAESERSTIDTALLAGANAYIVKSAEAVDVAAVVRQAFNSAVHMAPVYSPAVSPKVKSEPTGPELTDRERTILAAVSSGLTTAAISRELWVSEHTVKFHLTNIYRKLGVSNRAGAVRYALENDLAVAA